MNTPMHRIFATLALTCATAFAGAQNTADEPSGQESKMLDNVVADIRAQGYSSFDMKGFDVGGDAAITTVISGSEKKKNFVLTTYLAESLDGSPMVFRVYNLCTIENRNSENVTSTKDIVITVNGQRIKASSGGCKMSTQVPATEETYWITNPAGREFVQREFLNRKIVFVKIEFYVIPVLTKGFRNLWEKVSKPAL